MWLSNCFKIPKLSLRDFSLKSLLIICIFPFVCTAQTKVGFNRFSDLASDGSSIVFNDNKIFYSFYGNAATDANKPYNLNVIYNSSYDTLKTNLFSLPNNYSGSYFALTPFFNFSKKLFYWGVGSNYGSSTFSGTTFVFGNANQSDYSLINHKAFRSKYYHRPNYTNTFLNDSTFISAHWFKWSHPSSLPYGASIWWLNKNMDTLQQQVYFEASSNTNLLPITVYPLPNKDILVAGFTDTLNIYNFDAYIMRLDSAGNVKYARSIGTSQHENLYLSKVGNKYYFTGTSAPDYNYQSPSIFYVAEVDINDGSVGKTYKIAYSQTVSLICMQDPSVQQDKIYLPCMTEESGQYSRASYFLIDTNGVINKQYVHSQTSNGYWNSYTMPIVTDSLKNVYGSVVSYNNNTDPHYTKLFKLDSNLVGCYPSDTPFSFTTTIANGALHSLPMSISVARDSIFEVTTAGAIIQGHGFNTMVDECSGYVGLAPSPSERAGLRFYPNPSSGIFYYQILSDDFRDATIEIRNVLGELVLSSPFRGDRSGAGTIDLSSVTNGIYFVKIANAQKILFNTKLNVVK